MRIKRIALLGLIASLLVSVCLAQTTVIPPVAKCVEHRDVRHGETIIDNYYWLREKSNPEVIDYLKSENAYTDEKTKDLKPFEESLYKEILGHIKQTDLS